MIFKKKVNVNVKNLSDNDFEKYYCKCNNRFGKDYDILRDLAVDKDGRIIKIRNFNSQITVYGLVGIYNNEADEEIFQKIYEYSTPEINNAIEVGNWFISKEARDKAREKQRVYVQLKNIAERYNQGIDIDWSNIEQRKYSIICFPNGKIDIVCMNQKIAGSIYCLSEYFFIDVIGEIGEENLIKYFKE